jgi:ligand-binding sensor domain-containing protein
LKKSISLIILLSVVAIVRAQNTIGLPQIINFHQSTYQGGTQTWDIKQDEMGRMYFANNDGLLTNDGVYWKLYPQPNRSILRSIALDRNRIYAGGQDELGYYEPDDQGILKYTSLKNLIPAQYSSFTDVWDIEVFKQSVFFRTWDRIFELKNEAIKVYPAETGWTFLKKAGDKLIALERDKGLFQFVNNEWQQSPLATPFTFETTGIVALKNDSFLISSLQSGLFIYHAGQLTRKPTSADNSFIKNHVYCLEQINNSEFVAGTTSGGCIIINGEGEVVQQIARPEGLQNNNVLSVFLDKDHNLWTGLDNGISFIAYNSAIKYIKPGKPDERSGYSARVYKNDLYVATSDGLYVAPLSQTAKDFSFSKGEFIKLGNSSGQAWRLDEVNHQLMMGHHNGSFWIRNKQLVPLTANAGAWMFLPSSSIQPSQNILVGTYGGLSLLEYSNDRFTNLGEMKGLQESLRFLAIDNNNVLWASHPYRGIYKLKIAPDKHNSSYQLFTQKDGLPSTFRNNVYRVRNRIVFATENGIYEFDEANQKFYPSPQLSPVFGDMKIQYLNEDADGNIWFCSGKKLGVASFNAQKNTWAITYFPELTGKILAGFENVFPYNAENIFIASNEGIIHLNYKKYSIAHAKPDILIDEVRLSGKSDSLIFGGFDLRNTAAAQASSSTVPLQFPSSNNSFHFEFSSPVFGSQANITYSYRLKGYDREWSAPTIKTDKEYTNLPQGDYIFEVKAYDNLGHESRIVSYNFIINAPWYKTTWAYIIYVLLVVALIYFLHKWQLRKFERQQIRFEEEQKQLKYIHQLEVEKNEKEIIQLQNEKLINEMIYKNKELADVSMHLVERSDALTKVKDELEQLHRKTGDNHDLKRAIQLVNEIEKNNSSWEQFATHFDEINNDFIKKMKSRFPQLTSTDLKMCTYLELKLATKEIARLMNITVRGVEISRYRLRKKLQLQKGQTLNDFLSEIHMSGNGLK